MKQERLNHIMGRRSVWNCLLVVFAAAYGMPADAATINIVLEPAKDVFEVGEAVDVGILASTEDLLVGFGFDLVINNELVLSYDGFDADSGFTGVSTPDGDGLAGLSFEGGVVGERVLLGVAHYTALTVGEVLLELSTTDGDLTEGFARFGEGFFEVVSDPVEISIIGNLGSLPIGGGGGGGGGAQIPEPATVILLATGMLTLIRTRAKPNRF